MRAVTRPAGKKNWLGQLAECYSQRQIDHHVTEMLLFTLHPTRTEQARFKAGTQQRPGVVVTSKRATSSPNHVYQWLLKAATAPSPGDGKPKPDLADPAPGAAGRNRLRQPPSRTHLVVNDAQDEGAAGAGSHVLTVLQVLLQKPHESRHRPSGRPPGPRTPAASRHLPPRPVLPVPATRVMRKRSPQGHG